MEETITTSVREDMINKVVETKGGRISLTMEANNKMVVASKEAMEEVAEMSMNLANNKGVMEEVEMTITLVANKVEEVSVEEMADMVAVGVMERMMRI